MACKVLSALIFAGGVLAAQTFGVTPENSISATTLVTVKEAVNYKPQLEQQAKEISGLKTANNLLETANKEVSLKLDVLSKTNEEFLAALKKQDATLKLIKEELVSLEKNREDLIKKLEILRDSLAELNKKIEDGNQTFSTFKVQLEIARDDIKVKSDELRALKDIISINRGNIDSIISDGIDMKRQLREINAKTSSKTEEGLLGWEYWGVVASGIGILALILAIAK